jgi:hypothetical protein
MSIEVPNTLTDYTLSVTDRMDTNQAKTYKYGDFYDILTGAYRNNSLGIKKGMVFFEYYNAKTFQVKPRFDIDQKLYYIFDENNGNKITVRPNMNNSELLGETLENTLNDALVCLYDLFPGTVEDDYAVSKDCRWCKDKDEIDYYKISYHICYWKKKINSLKLKKYIEQRIDIFKDAGLAESLDLKIYMAGMTKWRIPYCKKISNSPDSTDNSLLEPMTHKDKGNFHKHLVTYVQGCKELKLDLEVEYKEKTYNKDAIDFENQMADNSKEIEAKKNAFTFIGVPKLENDVEYIDVKEFLCGKTHSHNHNFLIHDIKKNTLIVRCHSDKCENFSKNLHTPKLNYKEFNINYFNNIPLNDEKESNYDECKTYFELFFKFMRDSNSYYRIDNTFDRRLKYYERKIKSIKIEGYGDLLYKERKEGSVISKKFIEKYRHDNHKSAFFDLCFEPFNKNLEKNNIKDSNFNLFNGFNYESILTFEQRENIPPEKYKDLNVLLNHIKQYHCGDNEKHYNFLLQYLANIIQMPQFIPQIILVFYSSKHGTGKSNFTRFISEVIGNPLSFFGSLKQITETHTNAHLGKLLNIIEEVDNHSTRQYENIIKDYSQRLYAPLNQKNKDIISIKTFIRYIFTSNHYNGVYFDTEDRRYCVYTFEKIFNKEYIDQILTILGDNYVKYLFGKFLEEYKITYQNHNDWMLNRSKTNDYYNMMVEDSLKNFLKEIYANELFSLNEEDHCDFHIDTDNKQYIYLHFKRFNDLYKEFCKENAEKPQKITNINKQLTSTYKTVFKTCYKKKKRKFYRIDLFVLGDFLNLNDIKNNYNGFKQEKIEEIIDNEEKKEEIIEEILDEKK